MDSPPHRDCIIDETILESVIYIETKNQRTYDKQLYEKAKYQ